MDYSLLHAIAKDKFSSSYSGALHGIEESTNVPTVSSKCHVNKVLKMNNIHHHVMYVCSLRVFSCDLYWYNFVRLKIP